MNELIVNDEMRMTFLEAKEDTEWLLKKQGN